MAMRKNQESAKNADPDGHSNGFTVPGIEGDPANDSNQIGCIWVEVTGTQQHMVSVELTLDCNGGNSLK